MDYKYTLKVESELDEKVFEMSCLTMEGVEEELLRKAEHAIKNYESEKEQEQERLADNEAEHQAEMLADEEYANKVARQDEQSLEDARRI